MRKAFWLLLLALAACCPCRVKAGAWTLPKKGWYVEESMAFFITDEDFNQHSEKVAKPFHGVYDEIVFKTYLEYGITDRWNTIFSLPHRRAHYVDDYSNLYNSGFRDVSLGTKWRWLASPAVVSFALNAGVPTGYDTEEDLALGNGKGNVEGRVFVSRAFKFGKTQQVFAGVELAKDRYGLPYYAEITHLPLPWLFTKFYIVGQDDWPTQPDGEDFFKWNAGFGLSSLGSNAIMRSERYSSISLTLLYGQIAKGRNSGHGSDLTLSVAMVF